MTAPQTSGSLALQDEFQTNESSSLRVIPRDIFSRVSGLMDKAVEDGVFPGAVLLVGKNGEEVYRRVVGTRSQKRVKDETPRPMHAEMVFDVASLTQQVVTTTILMKLAASGSFKLDERVSRYLQWFSVGGKAAITIENLLNHTAGFPAWQPFYEELHRQHTGSRMGVLTSRGAKEHIYNALNRYQIKTKPGTREVYSDLGFMVLGHLIEVLTGVPLNKSAANLVFKPFGLQSTNFIDLAMIKRRGLQPVLDMIAPTEECSWRKRVLCGEVHEDNAWAMGGIAGHAGLFSSGPDLLQFGQEMLRAYYGEAGCIKPTAVRAFWELTSQQEGDRSFALGWQRAAKSAGLEDCGFSNTAVGNNSFTGCSLWIDPATASTIVLVSNRIHPTRSNKKINDFRKELFSTINQALV